MLAWPEHFRRPERLLVVTRDDSIGDDEDLGWEGPCSAQLSENGGYRSVTSKNA